MCFNRRHSSILWYLFTCICIKYIRKIQINVCAKIEYFLHANLMLDTLRFPNLFSVLNEPRHEKPVFRVSDQGSLKPAYAATETS